MVTVGLGDALGVERLVPTGDEEVALFSVRFRRGAIGTESSSSSSSSELALGLAVGDPALAALLVAPSIFAPVVVAAVVVEFSPSMRLAIFPRGLTAGRGSSSELSPPVSESSIAAGNRGLESAFGGDRRGLFRTVGLAAGFLAVASSSEESSLKAASNALILDRGVSIMDASPPCVDRGVPGVEDTGDDIVGRPDGARPGRGLPRCCSDGEGLSTRAEGRVVGGSGGGGGAVVGDGGVAGHRPGQDASATPSRRVKWIVAGGLVWLVSGLRQLWCGWRGLSSADGVAQSPRYRSRPVARAFPAGHLPSLDTLSSTTASY